MSQLYRPALDTADSSVKTTGTWRDSRKRAEDTPGGFVTALNSEPLVSVVQLHKGKCMTSQTFCTSGAK